MSTKVRYGLAALAIVAATVGLGLMLGHGRAKRPSHPSRPASGAEPKPDVATNAAAIDAASERRFELGTASQAFVVEVRASCAGGSCAGPASITLQPKSPEQHVEQTLVVEDVQFALEQDGNPRVNTLESYERPSLLVFGDFNFDGVEDMAVNRQGGGGYVGSYYDVYLGKPRTGQLQKSKAFSALAGPGSLGMFVVDRERKRLVVAGKDGCCLHVRREFSVARGRPRKMRSTTYDSRGGSGTRVTVADLAEDEVTVVPFTEAARPTADGGAADAGAALVPAFMVIAGDFATRAEAVEGLKEYEKQGWPEHDDYPHIVDGSTIPGLPPGRWLLAAALADERSTAEAVAVAIPGGMVREVRAAHPEALYLLAIERLTLRWQATDIPPEEDFAIVLSQHCLRDALTGDKARPCHYTHNGRSSQRVHAAKRMVLPFTYDPAGEAARILTISHESSVWSCDSEIVLRERPSSRTRSVDSMSIRCDAREE